MGKRKNTVNRSLKNMYVEIFQDFVRSADYGWIIELENGLNQFLDTGDWLYNFENENLQPKKQDIEARYLSQYFFSKLNQSIDDTCKVEITDSSYIYLVRDNKKTMFHFDVMNNPKESHFFGKAIKKESIEEWENGEMSYIIQLAISHLFRGLL